MTPPDYNSPVLAALKDAAAAEWRAYTEHAFVQQIGDGTLPRAAFLHYLVQDYVFLIHFSRAWAMAVVKSESLDEIRVAAGTVNTLGNHEIQLHIGICKEAGIDEETLFAAKEEVENLAYTRYVIDAGLSGDFLDLVAALAPCVFGYGEIGSRLAPQATPNNPYSDWINTYAGKEYQDVCYNVARMIDGSVAARIGDNPTESPRWTALCERFRMATELEAGFWNMGLRGGR
ncbi:MAG: thiaminase II [Hyphomicrobiaceae bacterium]